MLKKLPQDGTHGQEYACISLLKWRENKLTSDGKRKVVLDHILPALVHSGQLYFVFVRRVLTLVQY
jgi:hypothetical protein